MFGGDSLTITTIFGDQPAKVGVFKICPEIVGPKQKQHHPSPSVDLAKLKMLKLNCFGTIWLRFALKASTPSLNHLDVPLGLLGSKVIGSVGYVTLIYPIYK